MITLKGNPILCVLVLLTGLAFCNTPQAVRGKENETTLKAKQAVLHHKSKKVAAKPAQAKQASSPPKAKIPQAKPAAQKTTEKKPTAGGKKPAAPKKATTAAPEKPPEKKPQADAKPAVAKEAAQPAVSKEAAQPAVSKEAAVPPPKMLSGLVELTPGQLVKIADALLKDAQILPNDRLLIKAQADILNGFLTLGLLDESDNINVYYDYDKKELITPLLRTLFYADPQIYESIIGQHASPSAKTIDLLPTHNPDQEIFRKELSIAPKVERRQGKVALRPDQLIRIAQDLSANPLISQYNRTSIQALASIMKGLLSLEYAYPHEPVDTFYDFDTKILTTPLLDLNLREETNIYEQVIRTRANIW